MSPTTPLTAASTIGTWLEDPVGGPILADLLTISGTDPSSLDPVKNIPLEDLVSLSRGALSEEMLQKLVAEANGGVIPTTVPDPARSSQRFGDKTIIVTGAASGIGLATAKRIIAEGGRVVAVDLSEKGLAALEAASPAGSVTTVLANITEDADIDRVMAAAGERVDGLANVAGIMDGMVPLHEITNDLWDRVIAVNLTGAFKLTRTVLPLMMEQRAGSIVNVASQAALRGNAAGTVYGTSKHGLVGMTKSEAFFYGPLGIRTNAIAPGGTATGIEGSFRSDFALERMGPFFPLMPPMASAEDQAAAITWLLSDDSHNVNGVILPTDGGWSVQ